jgi:hypothetical protein
MAQIDGTLHPFSSFFIRPGGNTTFFLWVFLYHMASIWAIGVGKNLCSVLTAPKAEGTIVQQKCEKHERCGESRVDTQLQAPFLQSINQTVQRA